jgi:succinate dehydrogenase / fumarate reductase membrane anchor subunit
MIYKALKRKAVRLFSPKTATGLWRYQRLTAVCLPLLTLWMLYLLHSALHGPYIQVLGWLANPINSLAILAWTIIVFYHAALGVQTVLEDYVSNLPLREKAILSSHLFFLLFGITAVIAIIIIIFLGS